MPSRSREEARQASMRPRGQVLNETDRHVCFQNGVSRGNADPSWTNNEVKTSKYTCLNFVPTNLWEQLHKFGNSYFLCISIIMYVGEKTPLFVGTIKAFSTIAVLMMMMTITAVMALLDDLRRKEADAEINSAQATVVEVNHGQVETSMRSWSNIHVGDILCVRQDEEFPADMVLLYASGEEGNCYVSTANLDGETNLKIKTASGVTQPLLAAAGNREEDIVAHIQQLSGEVVAEAPNSNIHDFNGNLQLSSGKKESLGIKQFMLRGTVLRNTARCVGLVIYCGNDTRMVRNSRAAPSKQSNLEKTTNRAMCIILLAQALMAALSSVCHWMTKDQYEKYWYLHTVKLVLPDLVAYWLTFFTLYSNLMPISLYPTAEFCNAMQAYFIQNDKSMYYKEEHFCARARSSNLCQELGQVSYIFSDKTGTLTQNVMELKRLSIAGQTYGELTSEVGFTGARSLLEARQSNGAKEIDSFLEALAVAHTVMATKGEDGILKYEAESPDEYALVKAAADLGWIFKARTGNKMVCEVVRPDGQRSQRQYTVLATNEFNSSRKRMSVVVQHESEFLLFVKGADNVMLARAQGQHAKLEQDLKTFAREGLRTLVIGFKRLDRSTVNSWMQRYEEASRQTHERERHLEEVAEEIERPLEIVGATAIEDKLQDAVPETIQKLRTAGIKLWVLTGDKLETARNIGFSTNVLTQAMNIRTVDEEEGVDLRSAKQSFKEQNAERAMMVTGKALAGITQSESSKRDFLKTAQDCSVLIACRVSPMQKAELVRLVREGVSPTPVTLAVGDGANDVPMIQEAQVGVGIAGREGRQSVNNSDFAIGQFKYLQRLLLVHGRWNYRRACKFTLFTFWRNMVQVLMIFYYTFFSGYSGTVLFEDWIRLSFNVICSVPILAVGCFDQDVTAKTSLEHPELYEVGRLGLDLGRRKMFFTLCAAFVHSAIVFLVTILAFPSMDLLGAGDYYTFGTAAYSCLIVDMTYRAMFLTNTHNHYTVLAAVLSLFAYVCWLIFYPSWQWVADMLEPNMYMVPAHMAKTAHFWFCLISVPMLAMVFDVFMTFMYHHFFPDVRDQVQKQQRCQSRASQESSDIEKEERLCCDLDQASDFDGSSLGDSSDGSELSDDFRQLDLSDRAQQRLRSCSPSFDWWHVMVTGVVAGLVILLIGSGALLYSMTTKEVRLVYTQSTTKELSPFDWVHSIVEDPRATIVQECDGLCHIPVTVPEDMKPPILVYYQIFPFYQNYNTYLKSEVITELGGAEVSAELGMKREKNCWASATREQPDGDSIVPCGMQATSVFNDTFTISGVTIDRTNTAWSSDVERYNNPKDYPNRPKTSWLYERFPSVVTDPSLGVKTEAFVTWMRPSAIARVWNPYGYIKQELHKGSVLNITVNSLFNARGLGASKIVTLTEVGSLGGHHDAFGAFLIISGLLCFFVAGMACCIGKCGKDRHDSGFDSESGYEEQA